MSPAVLAVNIGNTNTTFMRFGVSPRKGACSVRTGTPLRAALGKSLAASCEGAVVCSVVPRATAMVLKELKGFGLRRVYIAGTSLPIPCASKYRGANLGADRLVNAYAAWRLLRKGCVVADSGTALTLDAVSPRGVYQGGVIAPGIGIAMVSLNHGTAQLPRLRPSLAPVLIGTDTDSSIRSGVVRGTAAMVESMTLQMCALMRCPPALVMTGADAALLARYLRIAYQVVPDLTLRGLYQAYCALRNAKEEYYAVT